MLFKNPVKVSEKVPMDYKIVRGLATGALCAGLLLMASRPFIISRLENEVQSIRTQATQFKESQSSEEYNQIADKMQGQINSLNHTMILSTFPAIGMSLLGLCYLRGRKKSAQM